MNFTHTSLTVRLIAGLLCMAAGIACAVTGPPPGVVVDYYNPAGLVYIGNGSIAIMPNGDYVASHDEYPGIKTTILRSQNKGADWTWVTQLTGQYESELFVHNGALYLVGGYNDGMGNEYIAIRKSTDSGTTWTSPTSASSGLLTPPAEVSTVGGYNGGATAVLIHNGRVWRAFEKVDPTVPAGASQEFRAMVVSAPVDANLLSAASWTISNSILMKDYIANVGWLEGGVVAAPDGSVKDILRVAGMTDKAAIAQVSSNGSTVSYSPQTIIDFPGGASKFSIRYDAQSGKYWTLANKQTNPTAVRNRLVLTSSTDLVNWTVVATILEDPDSAAVGFQYAGWQFDGPDIIFVLRTAYGGSGSFHDAEFMTFHRISNFRMLSQATTSTINSSDDADIDQHQNWASDTKGIAHPGWGWTATELRPMLYGADYYAPGLRQDVLIKWDITSIPATNAITAVTLELSGWDSPDGTIDVYGIAAGDWNESTVTWNSWAGTTKSLVLLGQFASAGPALTAGNTIFTNSSLTQWVRNWRSGSQANYGLILKKSGANPATGTVGDSFSAREETLYGHAPQLIIQHFPGSLFATVTGTVSLPGYTGSLQSVGAQIELRQNGAVARTEKVLLGAGGGFSLSLVPVGTYDVAVKTFSHLQKVLSSVNVTTGTTNVGTIVLNAGNLNGDSTVNPKDFAVMAQNWLAAGEP